MDPLQHCDDQNAEDLDALFDPRGGDDVSREDRPTVTVKGALNHETDAALYLTVDGRQGWVPLSLVDAIHREKPLVRVVMARWKAVELGWVDADDD